MTRMRQRIAQRLKDAQNTCAMLTTFNEIDMSGILGMRKEYKVNSPTPSPNPSRCHFKPLYLGSLRKISRSKTWFHECLHQSRRNRTSSRASCQCCYRRCHQRNYFQDRVLENNSGKNVPPNPLENTIIEISLMFHLLPPLQKVSLSQLSAMLNPCLFSM